jgi:hypothetical protein
MPEVGQKRCSEYGNIPILKSLFLTAMNEKLLMDISNQIISPKHPSKKDSPQEGSENSGMLLCVIVSQFVMIEH